MSVLGGRSHRIGFESKITGPTEQKKRDGAFGDRLSRTALGSYTSQQSPPGFDG